MGSKEEESAGCDLHPDVVTHSCALDDCLDGNFSCACYDYSGSGAVEIISPVLAIF